MKDNYLSPFIFEEAGRFLEKHYEINSARQKLRAMSVFGNWLEENHISIQSIDLNHVELFLSTLPDRPNNRKVNFIQSKTAARRVVSLVQKKFPRTQTAVEVEALNYLEHLRVNCGFSTCCFNTYKSYIEDFLNYFFNAKEIVITSLSAPQIREYFIQLSKTRSIHVRRIIAGTLKRYFTYLEIHGLQTEHLSRAIPRFSTGPRSLAPETISQQELESLLQSLDRSTPRGKRTYASILCMVELGMRVGDVARISLDDINWRSGTIIVRNKKRLTPFQMPLPKRVGEAIVDYITSGRPVSHSRYLFLNARPHEENTPATTHSLCTAIYHLWNSSQLSGRFSGTHIFRHSTATHLRCQGTSIKIIADILGHASIESTKLYAQVDIPALRQVALPWPSLEVEK